MPAQWPTFVNNVSSKLSSRNSETRDEFAVFLAGEYFDAVSQSQTTFGNTHVAGQKPILEEGFKQAFEKIYTEEMIQFEDKFEMAKFADFFEPLPNTDFDFDPLCEVEEWTRNNQDNLQKFRFYSFFNSTCPPYKEIDIYAGIDFSLLVEQNSQAAQNSIQEGEDGILYAIMSISNFTPDVSYKFLYSINGIDQPASLADEEGILKVRVKTDPGEYQYTFKAVLDSNDNIIKEINKSSEVTINDQGEVETAAIIPDPSIGKQPRQLIPELSQEELIQAIALRIIYQNDGSKSFKSWVDRLDVGYNSDIGEKVADRVYGLSEEYYLEKEAKYNNTSLFDFSEIRNRIPTAEQLGLTNTLNEYIFQSEHTDAPDSIPDWVTPTHLICKFTYISSIDDNTTNVLFTIDPAAERKRIQAKVNLYDDEKKRWWELLRNWANSQQGADEDIIKNEDGYNLMARAIIDYWKSTVAQPFKKSPPIPPCNTTIPLGGTYTPIYYGSEAQLANDLRRAWNTGKRFDKLPLTPTAAKAVASAVSVACAKHLLTMKFLYLGGITTPASPVPMVGFVPLVI